MLLVGANGAGKTTLLKILAGQHMLPKESASILGEPPFHTTRLTTSGSLAYIGGNWEREVAFAGCVSPVHVFFTFFPHLHSIYIPSTFHIPSLLQAPPLLIER
jgi:energy-coupling factor transporter ATP-binding protein EcfA2